VGTSLNVDFVREFKSTGEAQQRGTWKDLQVKSTFFSSLLFLKKKITMQNIPIFITSQKLQLNSSFEKNKTKTWSSVSVRLMHIWNGSWRVDSFLYSSTADIYLARCGGNLHWITRYKGIRQPGHCTSIWFNSAVCVCHRICHPTHWPLIWLNREVAVGHMICRQKLKDNSFF